MASNFAKAISASQSIKGLNSYNPSPPPGEAPGAAAKQDGGLGEQTHLVLGNQDESSLGGKPGGAARLHPERETKLVVGDQSKQREKTNDERMLEADQEYAECPEDRIKVDASGCPVKKVHCNGCNGCHWDFNTNKKGGGKCVIHQDITEDLAEAMQRYRSYKMTERRRMDCDGAVACGVLVLETGCALLTLGFVCCFVQQLNVCCLGLEGASTSTASQVCTDSGRRQASTATVVAGRRTTSRGLQRCHPAM